MRKWRRGRDSLQTLLSDRMLGRLQIDLADGVSTSDTEKHKWLTLICKKIERDDSNDERGYEADKLPVIVQANAIVDPGTMAWHKWVSRRLYRKDITHWSNRATQRLQCRQCRDLIGCLHMHVRQKFWPFIRPFEVRYSTVYIKDRSANSGVTMAWHTSRTSTSLEGFGTNPGSRVTALNRLYAHSIQPAAKVRLV